MEWIAEDPSVQNAAQLLLILVNGNMCASVDNAFGQRDMHTGFVAYSNLHFLQRSCIIFSTKWVKLKSPTKKSLKAKSRRSSTDGINFIQNLNPLRYKVPSVLEVGTISTLRRKFGDISKGFHLDLYNDSWTSRGASGQAPWLWGSRPQQGVVGCVEP